MHVFLLPKSWQERDHGANYLCTVLVASCLAFPFAMTFCSIAL